VNSSGLVLVGVAIVVGLAGVVVPVLPGALLSLAAILLWAILTNSAAAWVVFGFALVAIGSTQVLKYVLPGRGLRRAGIPNRTTLIGGLLSIVGFFVLPVVGMPVGFVLGVFLSEYQRLRAPRPAWTATVAALKATGWSLAIELAGALVAAGIWFGYVLLG
jgi:uncharacterized protein YqgC (DUF456 family)